MSKYKHFFIDLDRTIWDHERSSLESFKFIFRYFKLKELGIPSLDEMVSVFNSHNDILWSHYRRGEIKKELLSVKRFELTLNSFYIDNPGLSHEIAQEYVTMRPERAYLFPNAIQALSYLNNKYHLHIITNGFEEVQFQKLKITGIDKYFKNVITSEEAGVKKPDPFIFELAMHKAGASESNSIMLGDDLDVDIEGARNAGMDQLFFNPEELLHDVKVNYEIRDLIELKELF